MNVPKLRFAEFKEDWKINRLNTLFSIRSSGDLDNNLISSIKTESHKFPVFGNSVTNEGILGYYPHYEEEAPAITITGRGVNIGTPFYRRINFNAVGRLLVFHTLNNQTNPLFFSQLLSNLTIFNETTGVPQLTAPAIGNYNVAYPTLQEQDKIALFFDLLLKNIKLQQEKIDLLKEQKKGFMQKIFRQELRFKDEDGNDFPEWEEKKLSYLLKVNSGRDYKHLGQGNIPVYGTGGYMLSVDQSLSEADSIGIGRKGTIDVPQILKAPFWTVDTLFYCTPIEANNLQFIYTLFEMIKWKSFDESTGVPSLSKKTIENIMIHVPNAREQKKIGAFFEKINTKIDYHVQKLQEMNIQKQAFMQQMFI